MKPRPRLWDLLRLGGVMALTFVVIFLYYTYGLILPYSGAAGIVVESTLLALGLAGAHFTGILRKVQAWDSLALLEVSLVVGYFIVITGVLSSNGPNQMAALPTILTYLLVAVSEETLCRGYVLGTIEKLWPSKQGGLAAVFGSSIYFMLLHVERFTVGGFFHVSTIVNDLLAVLIPGLVLGLMYYITYHNLALTITTHFYWDAFAPLLTFPVLLNGNVLWILVFGLPLGAVLIVRSLAGRRGIAQSQVSGQTGNN